MMKNNQNELSAFRLRLQELLYSGFPELAWDKRFISERSALAEQAYENAFFAGYPIEQCNRIAEQTLFKGLYFSKFDTVFSVVCNEFDTLMADEELRPFALKMFPVCEAVFDGYVLDDDFAYHVEFEQLYTELTGAIQLWIDENGV